MATVYRGTVGDRPEEVAIKIMNPDLAKESRFVRRFRREAKAASMLKHPNTVQILEFGVDQGYVYLAMELLRGFDLAMLLHRERRIPEARAVQIVIQVCRALSAAHEQSIIHRDLKPDNIMLVRQPPGMASPVAGLAQGDFVKVLDFGIAKILDDDGEKPAGADSRAEPITQEKSMLTRVGTIVGTPAYMAPEQGRAEAVDARTDLYACGVLLYELITGRVPFTGETPMQVVMRHVNEIPRKPGEIVPMNRELERLIMRALAKYPSERQQSAEEMAFELLSVLPALTPAKAEPEALADVKRTLVLDQAPSNASPYPNPGPMPAPRPAAGAPAVPRAPQAASSSGPTTQAYPPPDPAATRPQPLPAAGRPAAPAARPAPAPPPSDLVQSPFPTLNIEVPDDIFPQGFAAAGATAAEPEPTRRLDRTVSSPAQQQPRPGPAPIRPAAGAPAAPAAAKPPAARPVPPVAGPADGGSNHRGGLDQTLQSHGSIPPPASEDEEEAPTVLKSPTETDKARMSLAEEAMAKALGAPAAAPPPGASRAVSPGAGLPKFSGPESVEPTLVAPNNPQEKTTISKAPEVPEIAAPKVALHGAAAPNAPAAAPMPAGKDPTRDLKNLQSTLPLDPEQVDQAVEQALARRAATPPPKPASPASPVPPAEATVADKPNRRPTSELIPVHLPDEPKPGDGRVPQLGAAGPAVVDAPLVWEPKAKRLSGATALIVGIAIGAILVAVAIGVAFLMRGE